MARCCVLYVQMAKDLVTEDLMQKYGSLDNPTQNQRKSYFKDYARFEFA